MLTAGVAIFTFHSPETGSSTAKIKQKSPTQLKRDKNINLFAHKVLIH